jgi:hypothetical protein
MVDILPADITGQVEVPEDIRRLANLATQDLYEGPLYFDDEGDLTSCFDPHMSHPFDFAQAVMELSDWVGDNISTMYYDPHSGDLMEKEPQGEEDEDGNWIDPYPYYEIHTTDIVKILFGRELAAHIR